MPCMQLLKEHVIVGQSLQSSQLKNNAKYKSALGEQLEVDTGYVRASQLS